MQGEKHRVVYFYFLLLSIPLLLSNCHSNPAGPSLSYFYRNKILFTSSRSGSPQLYYMNPDGTNIMQITNGSNASTSQFGIWSPDANNIAFNYSDTSAHYEIPPIYIMTPSGLNRRLIGYGTQISFSPDGSKIVTSRYNGPLYINDLNTGSSERTSFLGGAPNWSPDGKFIVFCYRIDSLNQSELSNEIFSYPSLDSVRVIGPNSACFLAWSPDGKYFAYSDTDGNVYTMTTDGTNIKKVTSNEPGVQFLYPRWSPDGNKLIFLASSTDGSHKSYLYMINIDGTYLHRVIDDPTVTSADWSR